MSFEPPAPPPIEPNVVDYMERMRRDDEAAHAALVVEHDGGLRIHVGPFPSADAAFAWNAEHRNGADAKVVMLLAPWRPWREPRR